MPIVGPESIGEVSERLALGDAVVLPTETVYGLACNALDPIAVARVYDLKGRPAQNPLIVHVLDAAHAASLAGDWPCVADSLVAEFWPGPLTLVVSRGIAIPHIVCAGLGTVALRAPNHPVFRAVLQASGLALAAPSANRSGALSPTTAAAAVEAMESPNLLVVEGGECLWGLESTVLDVSSGTPVLLRPGPICIAEIERCLGEKIEIGGDSTEPRSPGMIGRHYAPKTPVRLALRLEPGDSGLTLGESASAAQVEMPSDPVKYGALLFASLRALDALGASEIVVQQPPEEPDWDAVNDRLRRACQS
ncbi:MAG: L-threonylcarbamoyladenylate synthase [Fimbriimonadaceae bacterium]